MDHDRTVSMIIPVYNGGTAFRLCLEALARLDPPPLEIIVVTDGDATSAKTATEFNVRVVQLAQREGPAHARNVGACHARGEILFFIDADVEVPPNLLHRLGDAFNATPKVAAVIGSYDCHPAAPDLVSQYKNLLHHYVHQHAKKNAATFWGACGAVRRDVFSLLGGFDEKYRRPCVEDIEFGYRLRRAQYSILLIKTLQVKHLKQWSFFSLLKSDILDRALPWTQLILQYRQLNNDLNLRHSDRISVLLVYVLISVAVMSIWIPYHRAATMILMAFLLLLNGSLYKFFVLQRGVAFAGAAIGLHWLSFVYSGLAFIVGAIRHASVRLSTSVLNGISPRGGPSNRQVGSIISGPGGPSGGGS
jgi:GT2 family glycosyltransferase